MRIIDRAMGRGDKTTGAAISQTTPPIKMVLAITGLTGIASLHRVLVATDPMATGSLHMITPGIARTTTGIAALQRRAIGVHHNNLLNRIGIRAEHQAIVPMETGRPTSGTTIINVARLIIAENTGLMTIVGQEKRGEMVIVPPTKSILRVITSGTITPRRLITTTIAPTKGHNATTIATSHARQTRSDT
ncbi:hypothetical protein KSF_014790 [Reticulibacter mediterranei]|uniref:Uncharacterized protein n=1 Tax=Reticulibacter mediterranei TaxID=2778369 RepID=A0A8J3IKX9_9CHLR|nr:hypothetical protein KSF_014790 [Reticulibacter mediterranei]